MNPRNIFTLAAVAAQIIGFILSPTEALTFAPLTLAILATAFMFE